MSINVGELSNSTDCDSLVDTDYRGANQLHHFTTIRKW